MNLRKIISGILVLAMLLGTLFFESVFAKTEKVYECYDGQQCIDGDLVKDFLITAYYSPLPGQSFYLK
jgi:hypothetical protein